MRDSRERTSLQQQQRDNDKRKENIEKLKASKSKRQRPEPITATGEMSHQTTPSSITTSVSIQLNNSAQSTSDKIFNTLSQLLKYTSKLMLESKHSIPVQYYKMLWDMILESISRNFERRGQGSMTWKDQLQPTDPNQILQAPLKVINQIHVLMELTSERYLKKPITGDILIGEAGNIGSGLIDAIRRLNDFQFNPLAHDITLINPTIQQQQEQYDEDQNNLQEFQNQFQTGTIWRTN